MRCPCATQGRSDPKRRENFLQPAINECRSPCGSEGLSWKCPEISVLRDRATDTEPAAQKPQNQPIRIPTGVKRASHRSGQVARDCLCTFSVRRIRLSPRDRHASGYRYLHEKRRPPRSLRSLSNLILGGELQEGGPENPAICKGCLQQYTLKTRLPLWQPVLLISLFPAFTSA